MNLRNLLLGNITKPFPKGIIKLFILKILSRQSQVITYMAHSQLLRDVLPQVLILRATNTTFPTWENRVHKTRRKINLRNEIYELVLA